MDLGLCKASAHSKYLSEFHAIAAFFSLVIALLAQNTQRCYWREKEISWW